MPILHDPYLDDPLKELPYFPAIDELARATDLMKIAVPLPLSDPPPKMMSTVMREERDKNSLFHVINGKGNPTVRELLPLIEMRYKWLRAWLDTDEDQRIWPATNFEPMDKDAPEEGELDEIAEEKAHWDQRIREAIVVVERELGWGETAAAEALAEAEASTF